MIRPWTIWAFLVSATYVPLLPSNAVVGRWIMVAAGALALIWRPIRVTPGHVLGTGLLAYVVLSLMWTISTWDTLGELLQWVVLAAVFCVAAEEDSLDDMWVGLSAGLLVSVPFAILQLTGHNVVWSVYEFPVGLYLSKNMAADIAVLSLVGSVSLVLARGPGFAWTVAAPLSMVYLVGARSALLALIAALLGAVLFSGRRMLALSLSAAATVALLYLFFTGHLGQFADRWSIWTLVARNLNFLGDGLGSFAVAAPNLEYAHNEFLHYAFELGVPGSALLWGVVACAIACALVSPDPRGGAALAAFLALCAVWFPLHAPAAGFVGAALAGHLCGRAVRPLRSKSPGRVVGSFSLLHEGLADLGAMSSAHDSWVRGLRRGGPDLPPANGGRQHVSS